MSASSSGRDNAARPGEDGRSPIPPIPRRYSRAELAEYDGSDPARPTLIAYKGRVYDVTGSYPWARGKHWGVHAGEDLTGRLQDSIHGEEMLERVPCVGLLEDDLLD
jgi:predicted heme/steroid binding protein